MPGPIFLHCQTFARKPSGAGNSIAQVIGEVLREPEYSLHVDAPKPPRVILGNPAGFRAEHDAHVAARTTSVSTRKGVVQRAIRSDRHTLATIIASYPLTFAQIEAGGAKTAELQATWERETIAWVQGRYGDQLCVVVAHEDETHPHLHFWLLPDDPGADAASLHPGKVAKRAAAAQAKAEGQDGCAAVRAGNVALKAAMRDWLNAYYYDVGVPLGMTRDGPKRRRLARAEWRAEKAHAARVAEVHRRQEHQHEENRKMLAEGEKAMDAVMAKADAALERVAGDKRAVQEARAAHSIECAAFEDDRKELVRNMENLDRDQQKIRHQRTVIAQERKGIELERYALAQERNMLARERTEIAGLRRKLTSAIRRVFSWLKRPDLVMEARAEAEEILAAIGPICFDESATSMDPSLEI